MQQMQRVQPKSAKPIVTNTKPKQQHHPWQNTTQLSKFPHFQRHIKRNQNNSNPSKYQFSIHKIKPKQVQSSNPQDQHQQQTTKTQTNQRCKEIQQLKYHNKQTNHINHHNTSSQFKVPNLQTKQIISQ